ncbi:methyltransferase domain-containing protein [Alphaproteobacteria bacterium]|nr:methyltransferase domain-containing protein [Alphaproteobacteria bacterium]
MKNIIKHKLRKINKYIFKNNKYEDSVLYSLKKRPQAPYDFLSRYETILKRIYNWEPLDFKNKNVFELGCGPHLGFGPLAIFLGAKSFVAADPSSSANIFSSKLLKENYFLTIFKDLKAIYGTNESFEYFFNNMKEKTFIYTNSKEAKNNHIDEIDIQITNSCLEHIDNLENVLIDLKKLLNNNGRYLHGIDFGNHKKTKNPFEDIYTLSRSEYKIKFGNKINLLTPNEILSQFESAGFSNPKIMPYYFSKENFNGTIHPEWKKRLKKEEIFLKFGLIAGPI